MARAESVKTYCRICESACGLVVEKDEHGEPVRIRPDRDHPNSRGFVCAKGTRFLEVARHPGRLVRPMRRRPDGSLEAIAWDEALRSAGEKLRSIRDRHGPHAIGVYFGNPLAFNAFGVAALPAFTRALGTRNVYSAGSQDCGNKFAAAEIVHGSAFIHPIPDVENADLAVVFGSNPAVSQSSFVHLEQGSLAFDRLVERGGRVVWVDPRRTESARRWGRHVAIRPGSDVFLLLALVHELRAAAERPGAAEGLRELCELASRFPAERAESITGISAADIRALSEEIRTAPRAALHMSVGVNQGPFGTLSYVALQAVAYLAGHLDREGGSLFHPLAVHAARLMRSARLDTRRDTSRIGAFTSVLDTLPGGILADEILTPGREKIRALLVIAGDPLSSMPGSARLEQAFEDLELLACVDLFESRTGRKADLLLPAKSWLERWDAATTTVTFQTSSLIQTAGPVMPAPGEARHEAEILLALRRAMGLGSGTSALFALPWERLLGSFRGYGLPAPKPRAGRYLGRGSLHPGHVLRFWDASLEPESERLERFAEAQAGGLVLIGRRRRLGHNSWLHDARREGDDSEAAAWASASDLTALGLRSGQQVRIASSEGSVSLPVVATEGVAPGTIVVPHGLPGLNVNELIPSGEAAVERLSGMHHMTGIPVSVEPD